MPKYTKVAEDAFKTIQLNAGILVDYFSPATGEIGNIIGATSGGVSFATNPEYSDYGEDIDNVPANTMELKKLATLSPVMSGTFVSVDGELARILTASADIDDDVKIVPRNYITTADFTDIWWVGDYSDVNTGASAGFMAIHLMNALSTTGFQIQSNDDAKGTFSFEFTGHYSIDDIDTVPYELYISMGEDDDTEIILSANKMIVGYDNNYTIEFYNYLDFTGITVTTDNTGLVTDLDYDSGNIEFTTPNGGPVGTTATIFVTGTKDSKEYGATVKVELYE